MTKNNYTALYLPLSSSDLNPIEKVWSIVKSKWANVLLELRGAIDEKLAKQQLSSILESIEPETAHNLAKNDCKLMLRILKHEFVSSEVPQY